MREAGAIAKLTEWLLMLACAVCLVALACVHTSWQYQTLLGAIAFAVAWTMNRITHARWMTLALIVVSSFMTLRYAYWRATTTLGISRTGVHRLDLALAIILFLAECYAWLVLYLGYIQTMWPLGRKPVPIKASPDRWPIVDVMIPTYNEPEDVVRPTVIAATMMDWPRDRLRVHLLDDGNREEMRALAQKAGVNYIARADNVHAKAGNINHALVMTSGHFVAIFDCDHVPTRSFLQMTMGWFEKDPDVALIQTPHHFYSPDPFERNLGLFRHVPNEGELFYGVVQDGNDLWDAAFFCGSCAVMRREALDQIGGIAVDTVTEDAHTSLRMQRKGWKSAYLNIPQAAGLATESLSAHIKQRIRWARGMAQIFRIDNPLLGKGLGVMQRLCYLNAMLHFFFALPRLIFLTAPLAYLVFGLKVINAYSYAIAAYALPHIIIASLVNSRIQGKHRYSFWNEVYEATLAPYILGPVMLAFINPRLGAFNVTAKGGLVEKTYFDGRISKPFIVLFLLIAGGIAFGAYRWIVWHQGIESAMILNLAWAAYSLISVGATLAVSWEKKQVRQKVRVPISIPVEVIGEDGRVLCEGQTEDMSESGARIRASSPTFLEKDAPVTLRFSWNGETHGLPARVAAGQGSLVRARFDELDWNQQRSVVRLIYSRGDAWVGFGLGDREDKPFKSLMQIVGIALRGIASVFRALGSGMAVLMLAAALFAVAAPRPASASQAAAGDASAAAFSTTLRLSQVGYPAGIRLGASADEARVRFETYGNRVITAGKLTLRYKMAGGDRSIAPAIRVLFNGREVFSGVPPLQNGQSGSLSIPLDKLMITPHDTLLIKRVGADGCLTDKGTASLVFEPDSRLRVSGSMLRFANSMDILPKPFMYPKDPKRETVNIVFASPPGVRQLKAAGIVASWLGAMSGYEGVGFRVMGGNIPRGNAILIGRLSDPLVASLKLPQAAPGGQIDEMDNPSDKFGKLLVITGQTGGGIVRAAKRLAASGSVPITGQAMSGSGLDIQPVMPNDMEPAWASIRKPWPFMNMRKESADKTRGSGYVKFGVRIPPEVQINGSGRIPVRIDYRYSAPAGHAGKMTLLVNGHRLRNQAQTLPASSAPAGGTRVFNVPKRYFNRFDNTISTEFFFKNENNARCAENGHDAPWGQVLESSQIDLTGSRRFFHLPDLSLWANGAYPFTASPGLADTAFVLPDSASKGSITAYLDMVGFMSNQTGVAETHFSVAPFSSISQEKEKNLVIMGRHDVPMWRKLDHILPVRVSTNPKMRSWLYEHLPSWALRALADSTPSGAADLAGYLNSERPVGALIQESGSPWERGRVVMAVSSIDASGWGNITRFVLNPEMRKNIFGNVMILNGGRVKAFNDQSEESFYGDVAPYEIWERVIAADPLYMIGILLVAAMLAAVATTRKLGRQSRRRIGK